MISTGQNTGFSTNKTLNLNGRLMSLQTPLVMGIVNVTPDSFYDGGRLTDESTLLKHVEKMIQEGASIVDVGGYSSRPGARDIPVEEELKRVTEAIRAIRKHFDQVVLSVDTFRSAIAEAAVQEGAQMVNDISGGELDSPMFQTVAALQVPYICMHMKGTPQTMSSLTQYDNLLYEVNEYFHKKIVALQNLGIKDIIIDPGFGFSKTPKQGFRLLNNLEQFKIFEKPILVGLSRKSMIWRTLETTAEHALNGTTALNMVALLKGASIVRVHDVKAAAETIKLFTNLSAAH
jgi:dihydropteroate synthase